MVKAPIQAPVVMQTGFINRIWALFFTALADHASGSVPIRLPLINVADLPNPVGLEGALVYVPDESNGATVAFSDNVNWLRIYDRAIVT